MELMFLVSLITLISIFFLLKLIRLFTGSQRIVYPKLAPGPWKLPLLGSMHHLALAGTLPHHALKNLAQKYGPVMHLQLGEISTIVISAPQAAKEVLKVHDIAFAYRPELLASKILSYDNSGIAFSPYGAYWKQLRKICLLELLSPKKVRSFSTIREDEARKLVQFIKSSENSTVNLTQNVFSFANDVICRAAFGKSCKDQERLISLMNEAILAGGGFDIADFFPSLKFLHILSGLKPTLLRLQKQIDQVLDNIINEHTEKLASRQICNSTESGEEDLVDVLLRLKETGDFEIPISRNSIKSVIWDVFTAGTETSAATVDWAMAEMIRNPKVVEKAQAEVRQVVKEKETIQDIDLKALNYLKFVIKETLRMHPPLPLLLPRECREQCIVGGYNIPIKAQVLVNAWAINRDPGVWQNAESFEPERFVGSGSDFIGTNFEYIPFGGGRRTCPGISFGLATIELILAQLLYHFDWKLPIGVKHEMLDMTETLGPTARRKNSLYLDASFHAPLN